MKHKLHLPVLHLIATTLFICWATEALLQFSSYNIYRVLDLDALSLILLTVFAGVQYWLFKDAEPKVRQLLEAWKLPAERILIILSVAFGWGIWVMLSSITLAWLIFPFVLGGIILFYWLTKRLPYRFFIPLLLSLLWLSVVNASLIFFMHESKNEGIHERYANILADEKDTFAEDVLTQWLQDTTPMDQMVYWERKWLENPYLAKNYSLSFDKTFLNTAPYIMNLGLGKGYQVQTAKGSLVLTLKDKFSTEVYFQNVPYKNLQQLSNFLFTVVDKGRVALSNTHDFDEGIMDVPLPTEGTMEKIHWQGYDVRVYHAKEGRYVLIGEPLSEPIVWISNFSLLFSIMMLVIVVIEVIRAILLNKREVLLWVQYPIDFKLQSALWGLTLLFFYITSLSTYTFLIQNNKKLGEETQLAKAASISHLLEKEDENATYIYKELAKSIEGSIDKYSMQGKLVLSSFAHAINSPAPALLDAKIIRQFEKNSTAILVHAVKDADPYYRTYIKHPNTSEPSILALNVPEIHDGTANDIPIIMSNLLNVYVFLLLVTWCMGWGLMRIFTKPLTLIANTLHRFELGNINRKLEWESDDSIGTLVDSYNNMVDKVERTSKELMQKEREGAWQIMAQQIAHEINSHLTPLKLNIQYLGMVLRNPGDVVRIEGISRELVAKVDKLSAVARQFSLFAKLEQPQGNPLEVIPFMERILEPYQTQEDMQLTWEARIKLGEIPLIEMEEQHLEHVLQNILDNAKNAVPQDGTGAIDVLMQRDTKHLYIEISDNGPGIAPEIASDIFNPSFSTNNSNTGLGLPICHRIIQFYGGHIDFETEQGLGTTFRITLKLESVAIEQEQLTV